ncbi:cytochrome d ubiquinol oxidase subunit II [Nocardioides sp. DS6]|uniref:Cytochrome d ubiquinol oxidase subunit II n=1 Tax=Nocardioides eburneus TaxID=3231482 RepID=A0ABV3T181_9ACTN
MDDAWFAIVMLSVSMYVLLDGYDLGIGTLLLLDRDERRRREMVEIVATAWDGNETWLILFGVAAWAGLPTAYGVMLPALYIPLIVMLFSIIARGAAIELISTANDGVPFRWGLAFGLGSLIASFTQGVAIGGLLSGVTVTDGVFTGHTWDFLNAYSVLTGLATVVLYATAGAAFLRLKTEGPLRDRAGAAGRVSLGFTAVLSLVAALSLGATPTGTHLSSPLRVVFFVILVVVAVAGGVVAWIGFGRRPDRLALTGVVAAEVAGLLALLDILVPRVVPPGLTIGEAGAPGATFVVLLVGIGLNIPLVLFYSWYAHHVFRGKYREPQLARPAGLSASAQALRPSGPPAGVPSTTDGAVS